MSFIMELVNIRYLLLNLVLISLFLLAPVYVNAQDVKVSFDSTFTRLMDKNLVEKKMKDYSKPIVFVSDISCLACIKYFTTFKTTKYSVIFILQHESLLDIKRLMSVYEVKTKEVYFITCANIKSDKNEMCKNHSPFMLVKNKGELTTINYWQLDSITNGFSDKKRRFLKAYY